MGFNRLVKKGFDVSKNRVSLVYENRRVIVYGGCDKVTIDKDTLTIIRADFENITVKDLSRIKSISFRPEASYFKAIKATKIIENADGSRTHITP